MGHVIYKATGLGLWATIWAKGRGFSHGARKGYGQVMARLGYGWPWAGNMAMGCGLRL
jgi:hypothetical protein